ncbi:serine hydrolase domain-containing protein [Actinoplanes sp. NBRC 103695]|uniref:serine hydrolase domain-containing protein n=1 Tax=Actinoplanes sp. NBRC 103695 TaxID=3032202 RepID=UPI0024A382CB|nr:serine hydrolase domain-containing protein [Actinoplanes sp. NBRC 103695]GLZ00451.1 serine hydrolase [Actinoplanes sp. NBRC 103695]
MRSLISELLAEYGIPSAQIGILRDGEITDLAVGVADVTTGAPATTGTIYQCGSMTKTWTTLAFLQFVDEGRVRLDEPVRTYLPGFRVADSDVGARVTARHLLCHTSGIEEDFGDPGEDDDVYERMVRAIADAPQVHPLGYTHGYSAALGYAILARIMEVLDGKPWDDIMADRLFAPLGLTGTTSRHERVDHGRAATGHLIRSLAEGPFVTPVDHLPRLYGPGGNVTSTARDVLTMTRVILDGGGSIPEMLTSRVPVPDPYMFGPEWALGLIVCDWHGRTVYASDGSTIGQNARLRILPDSGTAIVMLTNGGPRDGFYRKVFNAILADLGEVTIPDLPVPDPALDLDLSRYEGVYERPGTRYEVEAVAGRLHLSHDLDPTHAQILGKPGRITYELLPVSPTHFLMPPADPLEDTQTVAIYDFAEGRARYLHTNCRVHPSVVPGT